MVEIYRQKIQIMTSIKADILAIGVHPDDVELSACGIMLQQIALGRIGGILDLTHGELGTRGSAEIRAAEAKAAANLMGVSFRENAGLADGFFENNPASVMAIIPFIREYKPEIVLVNAPHDRHPDHGRAAKLSTDACFYSGLSKIETEWKGKVQKPWRPRAVYHYIQDEQLKPDFVVDITPFIEKKMEILRAFKSQFYDPNSKEPVTPIAQKDFMDFMYAKNKIFARSIPGAEYAEGFICHRIPGVKDIFDLV